MKLDVYHIAHLLRDKLGWIWDFIEEINSFLFTLRYGQRIKNMVVTMVPDGFIMKPLNEIPTQDLVSFFCRQPENAYDFFRPHGFDVTSIKHLQRNKAFLAYVLKDEYNNAIAGYCFNRCFVNGVGYRGRMVDINYRGKGLGTSMNKILNEVGFGIGLRLFETVSKDNVASYRSAMSASGIKVMKEMPNNELYLEILPE